MNPKFRQKHANRAEVDQGKSLHVEVLSANKGDLRLPVGTVVQTKRSWAEHVLCIPLTLPVYLRN